MVEYDVGFDSEGKLSALRIRGYFLCGADMDLGARLSCPFPCRC